MKKWLLPVRIAVALALVLFLCVSPSGLTRELSRNPYREFLGGSREPEGFTGILRVYHVVSFKTAQGSVTAYLERCAAQYEKKHAGVFVEVTGLSVEAAMERVARGDIPDIWSVPYRLLEDYRFAPWQGGQPQLREGLSPYRQVETVFAMPYLYSGYFLLSNTLLTQNLGLAFPDADTLQKAQQQDTTALIAHLQAALNQKSTARHGALCVPERFVRMWGLTGNLATDGDFKAGQVPFMVGDARAYGDLTRKLSDNGFTFDAVPLGGSTDQVQYIGMDAAIAPMRREHAQGLMDTLFSQSQQSGLSALGAMPALELEAPIQYTDGLLQELYRVYASPVIAP